MHKLSVLALIPLVPPIKPWWLYVRRGVCREVGTRPNARNSGPGTNSLLLVSTSLKAAVALAPKAALARRDALRPQPKGCKINLAALSNAQAGAWLELLWFWKLSSPLFQMIDFFSPLPCSELVRKISKSWRNFSISMSSWPYLIFSPLAISTLCPRGTRSSIFTLSELPYDIGECFLFIWGVIYNYCC